MIGILFEVFLISLAIQIVFFTVAYLYKTDKVTDLSYGLTFIIISIIYLFGSTLKAPHIMLSSLVIIWGIRIVLYLFIRILKTEKDKRFDEFRHSFLKFGGFWLLQAISVWIIMIPAIIVLNSEYSSLNLLSFIGILVWLLGFMVEAIADQQKYIFKSDPKNKDKWINKGFWKYSRHPNYFGEILIWTGIFIFSIPYLSGYLWVSIISPIYIAVLLIFVSGIPPLEKKYDEKYKDNSEYQNYKNKTSILIPLPKSS